MTGGVDDPRRHTSGGDAGPFDSITLPHLVDEGYGNETEDCGHILLKSKKMDNFY